MPLLTQFALISKYHSASDDALKRIPESGCQIGTISVLAVAHKLR